ncbi:hypothetical protein L1I79_03520 [Strepomyces sp. STD 3.1]|nr:hypothetical protein [Streptomyces sp. STD 3.1]
MAGMWIPARADHPVRAVPEPAVQQDDRPVQAADVAAGRDIPHTCLEGILGGLRRVPVGARGAGQAARGGNRPV